LKAHWQSHVRASSGYLELRIFDEAAQVLEEIEPEERPATKTLAPALTSSWRPRNGNMVAAVVSHPVKIDPQTAGWWISLACG
jgi:hypothetical protein